MLTSGSGWAHLGHFFLSGSWGWSISQASLVSLLGKLSRCTGSLLLWVVLYWAGCSWVLVHLCRIQWVENGVVGQSGSQGAPGDGVLAGVHTKLQDTHFLIHLYVYTKLLRSTFSLDLRKPCCKLAKACLLSQKLYCY